MKYFDTLKQILNTLILLYDFRENTKILFYTLYTMFLVKLTIIRLSIKVSFSTETLSSVDENNLQMLTQTSLQAGTGYKRTTICLQVEYHLIIIKRNKYIEKWNSTGNSESILLRHICHKYNQHSVHAKIMEISYFHKREILHLCFQMQRFWNFDLFL